MKHNVKDKVVVYLAHCFSHGWDNFRTYLRPEFLRIKQAAHSLGRKRLGGHSHYRVQGVQ